MAKQKVDTESNWSGNFEGRMSGIIQYSNGTSSAPSISTLGLIISKVKDIPGGYLLEFSDQPGKTSPALALIDKNCNRKLIKSDSRGFDTYRVVEFSEIVAVKVNKVCEGQTKECNVDKFQIIDLAAKSWFNNDDIGVNPNAAVLLDCLERV